jgi:hypothetical protein
VALEVEPWNNVKVIKHKQVITGSETHRWRGPPDGGFRDGAYPVRHQPADAGRSNPEDQNMKRQRTYPLRLPNSIKAEVEKLAKAYGISINQFVATAVAEKLTAMNTATYFAERRARADFAAFDRLMRRKGGEPPRPDDTMP